MNKIIDGLQYVIDDREKTFRTEKVEGEFEIEVNFKSAIYFEEDSNDLDEDLGGIFNDQYLGDMCPMTSVIMTSDPDATDTKDTVTATWSDFRKLLDGLKAYRDEIKD